MIPILILIACTTVVFGSPSDITVSDEWESILKNLTHEAQIEYADILIGGSRSFTTLAEMDEKYDKWAEKHGISDKWKAHTVNLLVIKEKFNKTALSAIENLPIFYSIFSEIRLNRNQTNQEVKDAFHKLSERNPLEFRLTAHLVGHMIENEEVGMYERNMCSLEMSNSTVCLTVYDQWKLMFQKLTPQAREDYYQIDLNNNLTLAEIDKKLYGWAGKYGILGKRMAYKKKWLVRSEKINKIVLSVIENLPSVYRMYSEITSNRDQTRSSMDDALDELKETDWLEFEVILEIKQIMIKNDKEEDEMRKRNGGNMEIGNINFLNF